MLSKTESFLQDLAGNDVIGVNTEWAQECLDEVTGVQQEASAIKKHGLTVIKTIAVMKGDKELLQLLNGNEEYMVSAEELDDETYRRELRASDVEAIESGICTDVVLIRAF